MGGSISVDHVHLSVKIPLSRQTLTMKEKQILRLFMRYSMKLEYGILLTAIMAPLQLLILQP
jgi:hypothetical protein